MQFNDSFSVVKSFYSNLCNFDKLTYNQLLMNGAIGMAVVDLTGLGMGLNTKSQAELLKISTCALSLMMGIQGIQSLRSVSQPSTLWSKAKALAWGSLSLSQNIAAMLMINSLNSKVMIIGSRFFCLSAPCQIYARQGFWEAVNGSYKVGISKLLLGVTGTAVAGYYAYTNLMTPSLEWDEPNTLSEEQLAFLESHKKQIENLYECNEDCGNWTELGKGMTKKAFTHPDFPGMLVKVQLENSLGGDLRFRDQYYNLQNLKEVAKTFDRIVLPESHVFPTSKGLAIVEQKFDFIEKKQLDLLDEIKAFDQFTKFEAKTGLCDVLPNRKHNADYLLSGKIGIIDADCQDLSVQHTKGTWPINAGVAGLTAVAAVAKKIAGMNPDRILAFGFLIGGLVGYSNYDSSISFQYQLEEIGQKVGIAMGYYATAELGFATLQAVSKKLESCLKDHLDYLEKDL